jgi:hypothetical protein
MKNLKQLLFLTITTLILSCSTNDDIIDPISTTAGFTWRENDPNSTTIQTAYNPTFSTQFKTLIAKTQSGTTLFEVNLSGAGVGAYSVNNSSNVVTYTGVNPFFIATSGTVNITASANGKISGNFEAFRSGTGITRIYATFVDVTIIP